MDHGPGGRPIQTGSQSSRSRRFGGRATSPNAQLSERFRADAIDHKQSRWEYRLISRPVYRYQPRDDREGLDGALFLFCEGSDPELVLVIEDRPTPEGNRWHYALASLSGWEVHARLDGVEVWNQPLPSSPDPLGASTSSIVLRMWSFRRTKP